MIAPEFLVPLYTFSCVGIITIAVYMAKRWSTSDTPPESVAPDEGEELSAYHLALLSPDKERFHQLVLLELSHRGWITLKGTKYPMGRSDWLISPNSTPLPPSLLPTMQREAMRALAQGSCTGREAIERLDVVLKGYKEQMLHHLKSNDWLIQNRERKRAWLQVALLLLGLSPILACGWLWHPIPMWLSIVLWLGGVMLVLLMHSPDTRTDKGKSMWQMECEKYEWLLDYSDASAAKQTHYLKLFALFGKRAKPLGHRRFTQEQYLL